MEVFVENYMLGKSISINVDLSDTVLDIKKKIEKSQGIPVSKQTLFCKRNLLLRDDHGVKQYKIVNKSRLRLYFPHNLYQVLRQKNQSQVPSKSSSKDITIIEDSPEKNQDSSVMAKSKNDQVVHHVEQSQVPSDSIDGFFNNQDWSVMARSSNDQVVHQTEQPRVPSDSNEGFFNNQDWSVMARSNNDQVVHQAEQSQVPSDSVEGFFHNQDWSVMARSSNDQVVHQTEQPRVPSDSNEGFFNSQDWSVMARSNNDQVVHQAEQSQVPSDSVEGFFHNQDWSVMARSNDDQVVHQTDQVIHQTEQSQVPSDSIEKFLYGDEWPLTAEENVNTQDSSMRNINNQPPSNSIGDITFGEDQPLSTEHFTNIQNFWPGIGSTTEENQVFQTEQSQPSNSTEQRINTQDLSDKVQSSNQVLQTEKPQQSNTIKEVITITNSPEKVRRSKKPPQKLIVMVLPYCRGSNAERKFPVEVNASEKVEELKKELEKIQQRSQLKLPEDGYFFIHKQRVLDKDQTFRWNGVAHGDTIAIFPGLVRRGSIETRHRSSGHYSRA